MRVVQVIGVPGPQSPPPADVDAVVVALKSRTAPVEQAVRNRWPPRAGCARRARAQLYFKVCSTFDSTPQGNIGPVAEALTG
jgi:uncharacterized protein YgbK (DUF1537 family)